MNRFVPNIYTWTVTIGTCISPAAIVTVDYNEVQTAVAGPDQSICLNTSLLDANALNPGEIGTWTTITPGVVIVNLNNPHTAVNNLQLGDNTFTWTLTNGTCPAKSDNVTITYNLPPVADAGADRTICTNTLLLAANDPIPGVGQWSFISGGGIFTTPSTPNALVTNIPIGVNDYVWTVTKGACIATDHVIVYNLSVDAYINQPNPLAVCADSATIIGNNPAGQDIFPIYPASGLWTRLGAYGTFQNASSFQTIVNGLGLGSNFFRWTINNGTCSDFVDLEVINNTPTQSDAGVDTILCSYEATLSGNIPVVGTGFWRVLSGSATIVDPTLHNTEVTNLDLWCAPWTPDWFTGVNTTNTFEWVIQNAGCESVDQVHILNGIPGTIDAGIDTTVCDNVVNLDALDEGSCAQDHWWTATPAAGIVFQDPFDGTIDNTDFNAHVTEIQNGLTTFYWHKLNTFPMSGFTLECELVDTVTVTSLGLAQDVTAGQNMAVCADQWILNATSAASVIANTAFSTNVTGDWMVIHGNGTFDDESNNNTWVRNLGYDTNIFRWTLTDHDLGCVMSDDVYIHNGLPSASSAGPDRYICDDFAVISANVPDRGDHMYWENPPFAGGGTIVGETCNNFFCTAQVNNLSTGENVFVWHVIEDYEGPIAPYTVANPLQCHLTDTLSIFNERVTASAGVDIFICADTVQLMATPPAPGETGHWLAGTGNFASTGGNTSTLFNDILRNLTTGRNTITWTVQNGTCSDNDNIVVWNNLPPSPNANVNQTICSSTTQLTASPSNLPLPQPAIFSNYYGEWSTTSAATIDNYTNYTTWVYNLQEGVTSFFIWHTFNDFDDGVHTQTCELTDTMTVFNNNLHAEAGTIPGIICPPADGIAPSVTLAANPILPPITGQWTGLIVPAPISTIVTPSIHNTNVINMASGDHTYRWTIQRTTNGVTCYAHDDVLVKVRIPTIAQVADPDSVEICFHQATLTSNAPNYTVGETGIWQPVLGSIGTIADNTSTSTSVSFLPYFNGLHVGNGL